MDMCVVLYKWVSHRSLKTLESYTKSLTRIIFRGGDYERVFLLHVPVLFSEHMCLLTIKQTNKKCESSLFSELPQPWVSL